MHLRNAYRPDHPRHRTTAYTGRHPAIPRGALTPKVIQFEDYPEFRPNMTPEQMFLAGIFGGSYFRDIHSGITNKSYVNAADEFPYLSDIPYEYHSGAFCQTGINYFGRFSGTSKEYWEQKGWITEYDPYGWVQWYCRFHAGRRCPDDERQIGRWLRFAGKNGRFRLQLQRLRKAGKQSPTIQQALLQWGLMKL